MTSDLLSTWENGLACTGPARALVLHRAARPDAAPDELLRVPIGARAADLFGLRRALFGDRMEIVADCASCGEKLEFDLDAAALSLTPESGGPIRVVEDGWEVEFRLPTAGDLSTASSRGELLELCVLSAHHDGRRVSPSALPDAVQTLMSEKAEEHDISVRITCPACGKASPLQVDIVAYLWAELDFWARDLLTDVHVLAGAYGWTEPEILALSPVRRRYYLELCADA